MKTYYSNEIIWFGNREKEFTVNERTEKDAESWLLDKPCRAVLEERRVFRYFRMGHLDIIWGKNWMRNFVSYI